MLYYSCRLTVGPYTFTVSARVQLPAGVPNFMSHDVHCKYDRKNVKVTAEMCEACDWSSDCRVQTVEEPSDFALFSEAVEKDD